MNEFLKITFNGDQEIESTPDNTTLYTFMGKTAIGNITIENSTINHVYIRLSDEGEPNKGFYLFEQSQTDVYKTVAEHAIKHAYPQLLNLREVPECDLKAHMREEEKEAAKFAQTLPDFLPEDFK